MSELESQLLASVRQLVLDNLPYDRKDSVVVRELSAMPPDKLLILYFNWSRRIPFPRPRQVFQSKEFASNPILNQRNSDIQALIANIQSGEDLIKYLSRNVRHGYVNRNGQKPNNWHDLDLMLNAWGIHHLHFSQNVESDGFVQRDGPIVFAVFRTDRVYLVDIMTHKDWAKAHIIRVIVENWPEDGLVHELNGVIGLSQSFSDQERLQLRNAQINSPIEVKGKIFITAEAITTSGFSLSAVRRADQVVEMIERFAHYYEEKPSELIEQANQMGVSWPVEPHFVVEFSPDSYGVAERKSGTFFPLGPNKKL